MHHMYQHKQTNTNHTNPLQSPVSLLLTNHQSRSLFKNSEIESISIFTDKSKIEIAQSQNQNSRANIAIGDQAKQTQSSQLLSKKNGITQQGSSSPRSLDSENPALNITKLNKQNLFPKQETVSQNVKQKNTVNSSKQDDIKVQSCGDQNTGNLGALNCYSTQYNHNSKFFLLDQQLQTQQVVNVSSTRTKKSRQSLLAQSNLASSQQKIPTIQEWFASLSKSDRVLSMTMIDKTLVSSIMRMQNKLMKKGPGKFKFSVKIKTITVEKGAEKQEYQQIIQDHKYTSIKALNVGKDDKQKLEGNTVQIHEKEFMDLVRLTSTNVSDSQETRILNQEDLNTISFSEQLVQEPVKFFQLIESIVGKIFLKVPLDIEWDSQRQFLVTKTPTWFIPSINNSLANFIIFYIEVSLWIHYEAYVKGNFRNKKKDTLDSNIFISKEKQLINIRSELQEQWAKFVEKSNSNPQFLNELGSEIFQRFEKESVQKQLKKFSSQSQVSNYSPPQQMQINHLNGGLIVMRTTSQSEDNIKTEQQLIKALQQNKDSDTFFNDLCQVPLSKITSQLFQLESALVLILRERKIANQQSLKAAKQKLNKKKNKKAKKIAHQEAQLDASIISCINSSNEPELRMQQSQIESSIFSINDNEEHKLEKQVRIDVIVEESIEEQVEDEFSDESFDFQSNQAIINNNIYQNQRNEMQSSKADLINELLEDEEEQKSSIQTNISKNLLSQISFGDKTEQTESQKQNHQQVFNQISFSPAKILEQTNQGSHQSQDQTLIRDDPFFNYEQAKDFEQGADDKSAQQNQAMRVQTTNKKKKQSKSDFGLNNKRKEGTPGESEAQIEEEDSFPTLEIIRANKNFKQSLLATQSQEQNNSLNKKKKKKRSKAVVPQSSENLQDKSSILNAFIRNMIKDEPSEQISLKQTSFVEQDPESTQAQKRQAQVQSSKQSNEVTLQNNSFSNTAKRVNNPIPNTPQVQYQITNQGSNTIDLNKETVEAQNSEAQNQQLRLESQSAKLEKLIPSKGSIDQQRPQQQDSGYFKKQNRYQRQSFNLDDRSMMQYPSSNYDKKPKLIQNDNTQDLMKSSMKKHPKTRLPSPAKAQDPSLISSSKFQKVNQRFENFTNSRTNATPSVEPMLRNDVQEQNEQKPGEAVIKLNNPNQKKKTKSKNKKKNLKSAKTSGLVTPSEYPMYDQMQMNGYYGMGMYQNPNLMMPQYNMNFNGFQGFQSPLMGQQPYMAMSPPPYHPQIQPTISPVYNEQQNYNEILKTMADPRSIQYLQSLINQAIQNNANLGYQQNHQQFIFNPQDIPKDPYQTYPLSNNRADQQNKLIEEFYDLMENQMNELTNTIEQKLDSVKFEREQAICMIESIIRQTFNQSHQNSRPILDIQMYGSMASKLAIEQSDVDLAVVGLDFQGSRELQIKEMRVLYEQLKQMLLNFSTVQFIDTATVPVIKLHVDLEQIRTQFKAIQTEESIQQEQIDSQMKYLGVDVTFEDKYIFQFFSSEGHRANLGIQCISFIQQLCESQIDLKPIVLFLKKLLQFNDLNQPYHGGLNSYSLILMTSAFLKKFSQVQSMSKNLVELLRYFGYFFDPDYVIIDNQDFIQQTGPSTDPMTVIDPLNRANNTTRSAFRIKEIQEVFKRAYTFINHKMFEFTQQGIQRFQTHSNYLNTLDQSPLSSLLSPQFSKIICEVLDKESQVAIISSFM